ncbi:MAG: hemerythrin family protein [Desulfovibrio sp.]|nr:hemerythrin family protein [Desulfovibrio sp.]MBI4960796.1 hemerythrin family protein [Desulfovibrio sp.]
MALIEWEEDMGIGVPLIDDQHRELVDLINNIDEASRRNVRHAEMSDYIKTLYHYIMVHFQDEEALMDPKTYPEYYMQVHQHLAFSQRIMEFYKDFIDGSQVDMSEILTFIATWFRKHTTGLDRTLIPHLHSKDCG